MPIEIVLHLRVGSKELELTESEARELFELLGKLFGLGQMPPIKPDHIDPYMIPKSWLWEADCDDACGGTSGNLAEVKT